jgi:hypothetical protein
VIEPTFFDFILTIGIISTLALIICLQHDVTKLESRVAELEKHEL